MKFSGKYLNIIAIAIVLIVFITLINANIPYDPTKEIENGQVVEVKDFSNIVGSLNDFFGNNPPFSDLSVKNAVIIKDGNNLKIKLTEASRLYGYDLGNVKEFDIENLKGNDNFIVLDKNGQLQEAKLNFKEDNNFVFNKKKLDVLSGTSIELKNNNFKIGVPKNTIMPIAIVKDDARFNYEYQAKEGSIYLPGNIKLNNGKIFFSENIGQLYLEEKATLEGIEFNPKSKFYVLMDNLNGGDPADKPDPDALAKPVFSKKLNDYVEFKFERVGSDDELHKKISEGIINEMKERMLELNYVDKAVKMPVSFSVVSNKNPISFKINPENLFFTDISSDTYLKFEVGGMESRYEYALKDIGVNSGSLLVAFYEEGVDPNNPEIKTFIHATGDYNIYNGKYSYFPELDENGYKKLQIGKNDQPDFISSNTETGFRLRGADTIFVSKKTQEVLIPGSEKWKIYQLTDEFIIKEPTYVDEIKGQIPKVKTTNDYRKEFEKRDPYEGNSGPPA
ncbi:hypothetical protein J4218_03225 [Candidatus Pacearchaeota archaeon]|nr:hypothetical protein [Candidatus Pacearchaeota archaeon]